jgi:hypothetical protein
MWLFIPSRFVPAELPGSTLDLESLARELALSVTWKGKKRHAKLWLRDLRTGPSKRLPYGRISQRSMHLGFEAWLQSRAPGSPASLTRSPENAPAIPTSAPSGPNLYEWWERCSRRWFSSKMFLNFFDTSDQSEMSYNDWATALRSRYSSRLPMSARAIDASESLSWPTMTAHDQHERYQKNAQGGTPLTMTAQMWPTARAEDGESCGNHPDATDSLTGVTKLWRTPDAPTTGGTRNRQASIGKGHQTTVAEQAEHWQTPAADSFRSRGGNRKDEMDLDQQARFFPTPAARDYRTPDKHSYQDSLPDHPSRDGLALSSNSPGSRRRLNPAFVAWLMGFPFWWTNPEPISFARSETQLYLCKLRTLLQDLLAAPGSRIF